MSFFQRRVGAGKVGVIVAEFAMLVATRDARRSQQRLRSCPHLAVAARHAAVVPGAGPGIWAGRNGLPAGSFTKRANFRGSLDTLSVGQLSFDHRGHIHLGKNSPLLTLHPKAGFAQAANPVCLCTSCEPAARAVEGSRKTRPHGAKQPLRQPQFGPWRCETGFRRGFSQLTFAAEGGEYKTVRFPNSAITSFPPGVGWERTRPARRDYEQSRSG